MDYKLIQNQILWTDIIRILRQNVRRITDIILGVKGLMQILKSSTQSPVYLRENKGLPCRLKSNFQQGSILHCFQIDHVC